MAKKRKNKKGQGKKYKKRESKRNTRNIKLTKNNSIFLKPFVFIFLIIKTLFPKPKQAQLEKKAKPKSKKSKKLFKINLKSKKLLFFTLGISLLIFFVLWVFWGIPLPTNLSSNQVPVSTKLFDRNGQLIYEIYTDERRTPVSLNELPEYVKEATIAIEDKDFYNHYGISISGITRAAFNTVFKKKLQGGSTLTQQLIKNALLSPERTIRRKVREFALTIVAETIYSKDQILELYLNQIPYGGTAYGIGAASELYFNKNAKDLTLAEAALLAGLPASPSRFSPFGARPELAKGRQEVVLSRMVEDGYIQKEEAEKAIEENLGFAEPEQLKAPHFALWVKQQLAEKYGESTVEKGGLRVTTTLDLALQEHAESAVASEVEELSGNNVGNGAALVTRPSSGEILAMVGSKNYFAEDEDGKVNIIFANRQPGSSIKPINYALALRDKKIALSTPLADVPTCFSVFGQPGYCPRNYDFNYHGAVQARFALGNSYNIPAVRVLALNGIENFIEFANQMGISTFTEPENYGLSLTLGGGEVTPFDMAQAFGVFANEGIKAPLISILKVEDWKGKVLEEVDINEIEGDRILTPDVTFLISHTLHDNNARSAAFGAGSFLNVREHSEVSVKTGTTNDLRDNWTIGYTAHALVVTWVGNNDNAPMSRAVSGVSGASPIWNSIMKEVLDKAEDGFYNEKDEGHAWPRQPDGIIGANVCNTTGNRPGDENNPDCPIRFEYFLEDKVGANINSGSMDLQIDKNTQSVAVGDIPPEQIEPQNHSFLLDPLGTLVCLDCPLPTNHVTIGYPLRLTNDSENGVR